MTDRDWKARQEDLLELRPQPMKNEDRLTALLEFLPDEWESDIIQTHIGTLFDLLPRKEQEATLERLTQMWDHDDE